MSENPFPQKCARHPEVAGPFACTHCGNHFCIECCYSMPDGTISCQDCYANTVQPVAASPVPSPSVMRVSVPTAYSTPQYEEPVLPGQGCIQHPTTHGIFTCRFCGARSCGTCDFFFPPDM